MNENTENLNEEKKIICCETENKSLYRFGDGEESMSIKDVPIAIGSKRMLLEVDVVKNNIPLLISKGAISKLGMKIDLTRHKTEKNAEVMKLLCISSDHFCVSLATFARENCNVIFHLTNLLSWSNEVKKEKVIKLHCQLCHVSKDQLVKFLKDSCCDDKKFLKMIVDCCDNCKFCLKFKKPFPRLSVRFPVLDR